MLTLVLVFVLLGAVAGLLAGLFGIGGGAIMVPVFFYVFQQHGSSGVNILGGVPVAAQIDLAMHLALASSLAAVCFSALSSTYSHHQKRGVRWPIAASLTPGLLVGALAGGKIAAMVPGSSLEILFGGFLIYIAAQLAKDGKPIGVSGILAGWRTPRNVVAGGSTSSEERAARAVPTERLVPVAPVVLEEPAWKAMPSRFGMAMVGVGIGIVSTLLGIGGGSLTVPFLVWRQIPMPQAVGTSAACGFPIALAGAISFAWAGFHQVGLPEWASGFVYWPAVLPVAASSVFTAPMGAQLAHRLPILALKRAFAVFLVIVGITMLL